VKTRGIIFQEREASHAGLRIGADKPTFGKEWTKRLLRSSVFISEKGGGKKGKSPKEASMKKRKEPSRSVPTASKEGGLKCGTFSLT